MSIIKIQRRENPFVQIDKSVFEDTCISWKAKGILGYLLSKPDGWRVHVSDIVNHAPKDESGQSKRGNGEDAVYQALNELRSAGYAKLETKRESGVIIGKEWAVSEIKEFLPCRDNPDQANPDVDNPDQANTPLSNNELSHKEDINNENSNIDIVADAPNPEPETLKEAKKTKKDTPAPRAAKVDYSENVAEIVAHLNLKAKSRFRPDTSGTVKNISGRLKQGYTVDDFKTVIDFKCSQWLHDTKMCEFLRPETLFCEKHFEGYLNAANIWVNNGRPAATSPAQQRNQSVQKNQEDLARAVMANRKYYPPIEF